MTETPGRFRPDLVGTHSRIDVAVNYPLCQITQQWSTAGPEVPSGPRPAVL
jgi:hypothetical protein